MAYAALVSVSQTLEQILDFDPYWFPKTKEKLESFQETIASLIAFLDNCPPICTQAVNNLIKQIKDSAHQAEDVFESLVATHFMQKYETESCERFKRHPQSMDKFLKEDIASMEKEIKNYHDGVRPLVNRIDTLAGSTTQHLLALKTLLCDPYFLPIGEKEKAMESFQEITTSFKALLDDCPPTGSLNINYLITEIRNKVYETEYDFQKTSLPQKNESDLYAKFKIVPQCLEKVMEDIEMIEKEAIKIHGDGGWTQEQRIETQANSSRSALISDNTNMVALDDDLEMKLLDQLVGGQPKIEVIPIVGMGGIGKTTLARILYNRRLIKESFEIRGWVTISQTYKVEEIVSRILKDIGVPSDGKKDVGQHLYQSLYGRKYLIVLDDVWSKQAWDSMKWLFGNDNNGSRIILTTRNSEVAAYANSFGSYDQMQLLNEDLSWTLLCKEIFPQQDCPCELVNIGKQIAKQCQGLPLAISAIGGLLKKEKQTEEYWKYVSENVSSVLRTTNDPSLDILTLSYNYLPNHLKACFLYFGSFEEDRPIRVSDIVKLWVAEGFVKASRWNSAEEVAEKYLTEVIERNLIFVSKFTFRKPKRCGIHDLFRDICIREAKKEKFLCVLKQDAPVDLMEINSQRRLIVYPNTTLRKENQLISPNIVECGDSPSSNILRDGSCVTTRSFINHGDNEFSPIKPPLGLLKVLNMRSSFGEEFPVEILELVNLRYLDLENNSRIPPSISRLGNLQTLILHTFETHEIPSAIWEMPQLKHILIWIGFHLPEIQDKGTNTCFLKNLETLSKVINFRCTKEVLARIPNLKKLKIAYKRDVADPLSNLANLCQLESLRLRFKKSDGIWRNLAFPISLKKLVLIGSEIPWERMAIVGTLPRLEVLKLRYKATKGKSWETNDGEFKQLKFLSIEQPNLVKWITDKDHFPSLGRLLLRRCSSLKAIPSEIGEIPTLETIELVACSPAIVSSAQETLGEYTDIKLIVRGGLKTSKMITRFKKVRELKLR